MTDTTTTGPAPENKGMTDQEIQKDRNERIEACQKEVGAILDKYEFGLTAEDSWTPNTKVQVQIKFVDLKKYDSQVAQPTVTVPANHVAEGIQPDGSVVINKESLNDPVK